MLKEQPLFEVDAEMTSAANQKNCALTAPGGSAIVQPKMKNVAFYFGFYFFSHRPPQLLRGKVDER